MAEDWKEEFDRRNAAQMDKAMRPRQTRPDETLVAPPTTAEAVADSVGSGPLPERVAPLAGHPSPPDSRGRR